MKSLVSIVKVDELTRSVQKAIELAGGFSIDRGDTVVIKPNVKNQSPPGYGIVTDPRVVDAVVEEVFKYKPGKVRISEGAAYPTGSYDTISAFQTAGYFEVARKWDIELLDLNGWDSVDVDIKDGLVLNWVRIGRSVIEADYVINVPVLKTHRGTLLSACLKNIGVGCAVREEKKRLHRLGLDEGIVDVFSAVKPGFHIVDAIVAMEGDGPNYPPGKPKAMDLLIAGRDGLAVDAVCCKIMGFKSQDVRHLKLAGERDLGNIDLGEIDIIGAELGDVASSFELPSTYRDL